MVLLPCNLAAYWFKVDCYSRLIFSVVKFGAGPLYALRANKLVLVSFIAETTQWLPVTLGQTQPLIQLSSLLLGVISLVCNSQPKSDSNFCLIRLLTSTTALNNVKYASLAFFTIFNFSILDLSLSAFFTHSFFSFHIYT